MLNVEKWKIDLCITELDGYFEYRFNVSAEVSGTEAYANYMLDKYVTHFEGKGYVVGGGMVRSDGEE